ncbi:hypothetical protein QKA_2391 [Clostridioides difficile DA00165]|nr:hypothetical protein QKA_2391 [Clostridioides difficile DA00165]
MKKDKRFNCSMAMTVIGRNGNYFMAYFKTRANTLQSI